MSAIFGQVAFAATPTPYLQDSTIVGTGDTLTINNVPVQTSTGSFVYQNVTIQFNATVTGGLTVAPGFPKVVRALPLILDRFVAGDYVGPPTVGTKLNIAVKGPGLGVGGATAWSLTSLPGASCGTYPNTATWYTGPIASNPLATRIKKAGIISPFYSYGIVGASPPCGVGAGPDFLQGALIGVSQVEGTLTIVSFTNGFSSTDSPLPLAEITYTPVP